MSHQNSIRAMVLMPRYLSASEPWLLASIQGLGDEVVGIAGRSIADQTSFDRLIGMPPFFRLRSRNVIHRILPKSLRRFSPYRGDQILKRAIEQTQANCVLCHFGTMALDHEQLWNEIELPLYVHFHGFDTMFDLRDPQDPSRMAHSQDYQSRIVRLSHRATFITNSKFTADRLIQGGVDRNRIIVKYLGVPISDRPAVHSAKDVPTIVSVGRFVDCKGMELTVKAFAQLRAKGVRARLVIVGDGSERPTIEQAITESGCSEDIDLLGWKSSEEVRDILRHADIFTIHNRVGPRTRQEEALNLSVIEAMALGLPVVSTKSGGVVETVVDGETGLLGEPGDIDTQAKSLEMLVIDAELRQSMGLSARERAIRFFSVEQELKAYREILASGFHSG